MTRVLKATTRDGRVFHYVDSDSPPSGAMKKTYFAPDRSYVVQFFLNSEDVTPEMKNRIAAIIGRYNPTLPADEGGALGGTEKSAAYFKNLYCWPFAIVEQPEFGIVSPTYPANFFFDADSANNPNLNLKGKDKKGNWFTTSVRKYLAEKELGNFQKMLGASISLARAVRRLHQAGLAHSDLSSNNVLIDPKSGGCVIIDIDSLVVDGLFPPQVAGTKGYIAPEVIATMNLPLDSPQRSLPCVTTDLFALPVLIYQYLLQRHPLDGPKNYNLPTEDAELLIYGEKALFAENPNDQSNRPADLKVTIGDLGHHLESLFLRAFVDGLHSPADRPSALEWEKALVRTWDLLQPCENPSCSGKWFVLKDPARPVCPFCGTRATKILRLRLKKTWLGRNGQWRNAGEINVYDKMPLCEWHFKANVFPDEKVNREVQAYVSFASGKWLLINRTLRGMTDGQGRLIPPGGVLELYDGCLFRASEDKNALLAEVEIQ